MGKWFFYGFFCLFILPLHSQELCSGSLGEPIVFVDFGAGGVGGSAYGPSLTNETTYTFIPPTGGFLIDGQYRIANNSNLGRPEWHNSEDHTPGDVNGYMFIVNASYDAGEFYRKRITGLCENTTFELSAWILNALPPGICGNPRLPDIQFELRKTDGTLITSKTTGNLPETGSPEWKQFGVTFSTDNYTELDFILINNAEGGCGNDLAIDDIEFRACGDDANISWDIDENPPQLCPTNLPDEILLSTDISGDVYDTPFWIWQQSLDGVNWVDYSTLNQNQISITNYNDGDQYRYLLANSLMNLNSETCRVISEVLEINILDVADHHIQGSSILCANETLQIELIHENAIQSLLWTLPDNQNSNSNPLVIPSDVMPGMYNVDFIDEFGCPYSDSIEIKINPISRVDIEIIECAGTEITIGDNETYVVTTDEVIERTIPKIENNCDSIITYTITAFPTYDETVDSTACFGTVVIDPDGNPFTLEQNETFIYPFLTKDGCDSIITKNYMVPNPSVWSIEGNTTICDNETLELELLNNNSIASLLWMLPDGTTSTANPLVIANNPQAGTYSLAFEDEFGCSYSDELDIVINETFTTSENFALCQGSVVTIGNGENYTITQDETITRTIPSLVNGCDSTITYAITAFPTYQYMIDSIQCYGSEILDPNNTRVELTESVTYTYSYLSRHDCDSVVVINYIVPDLTSEVVQLACEGDTILLPDQTQISAQQSFTELFVIPSEVYDCDSTITFTLDVSTDSEQTIEKQLCVLDNFILPDGTVIEESGTYPINYITNHGCDSIINYDILFTLDSCDFELVCTLRFPNAVSPNNDGNNESFKALTNPKCEYENYSLKIYNRWGEKVFETDQFNQAWNPLPQHREQSFLWVVHYELIDPTQQNISKTDSGIVLIM